MRLLITFCLFSLALALPPGLANLFKQGGGGGGDGPLAGLLGRGGGGMGGLGGDGPSPEMIQRFMGSCSCDAEPRPRGKDCWDQMKAVKECAKDRIGDDLEDMMPSEDERAEMKEKVKALKKDILDNCFKSPCKNPREAMRKFGSCMLPKVTKRGGVLPRFKKCMNGQGVQIPKKLQEKAMNKAQKMFTKMMGKGDDEDEDEDDDEEEEGMKGIGMMMMGGAGGRRGKNKEKKLEMLEKLAGAVCPKGRAANRAASCVRRKIQRANLNKGGRSRPNPMQMGMLLKEVRPCGCQLSDDCKDNMKEAMEAVCTCKDKINKRKLKRDAGRCAKQAGINTDGLGDMMEKINSKMSKMCDEEKREKMEKMKAALECS